MKDTEKDLLEIIKHLEKELDFALKIINKLIKK